MIKIRTMCSVYNMYIQLQLNKKTEAANTQKELIRNYLGELKKIKANIEHYIDYNALLNGRVKELPEEFAASINNFKLSNIIVKNYYNLYKVLLAYETEIAILKKQQIKYNIYKDIISSFNKAIVQDMIDTGEPFENIFFGNLRIIFKDKHNKSIDWAASLLKKQELIDKGIEPYLRENYLKALEEGREYKAEKWLIKREPRKLLSLKWQVANRIINEIGREGANYKFFPARGNSGIISFFMKVYENPNHNYSIYNTK